MYHPYNEYHPTPTRQRFQDDETSFAKLIPERSPVKKMPAKAKQLTDDEVIKFLGLSETSYISHSNCSGNCKNRLNDFVKFVPAP